MPTLRAPVTVRITKKGKPYDVPAGEPFDVDSETAQDLIERFGAELAKKEKPAAVAVSDGAGEGDGEENSKTQKTE